MIITLERRTSYLHVSCVVFVIIVGFSFVVVSRSTWTFTGGCGGVRWLLLRFEILYSCLVELCSLPGTFFGLPCKCWDFYCRGQISFYTYCSQVGQSSGNSFTLRSTPAVKLGNVFMEGCYFIHFGDLFVYPLLYCGIWGAHRTNHDKAFWATVCIELYPWKSLKYLNCLVIDVTKKYF